MILALLIGTFYELYLDIALTKYYLKALHTQEMFYVCALPESSDPLVVFDRDFQPLQSLFVPPFFSITTKSLSAHSQCFLFSSHAEGFLPGSLKVRGPGHQSRWTLSYAGRLKYQPWEGSCLNFSSPSSIETEL